MRKTTDGQWWKDGLKCRTATPSVWLLCVVSTYRSILGTNHGAHIFFFKEKMTGTPSHHFLTKFIRIKRDPEEEFGKRQ